MTPIHFAEETHVLAKDQPTYQPLPVHVANDPECTVTSCWELSVEEIELLFKTRKIWWQQFTFGATLQPQLPSVEKPDLST